MTKAEQTRLSNRRAQVEWKNSGIPVVAIDSCDVCDGDVEYRMCRPRKPPAYPRDALMSGHAGKVQVRICVDITGKPVGEPTVHQSCGNALLDDAALAYAKDVKVRITSRGTGRKLAGSAAMPVDFSMEDAQPPAG